MTSYHAGVLSSLRLNRDSAMIFPKRRPVCAHAALPKPLNQRAGASGLKIVEIPGQTKRFFKNPLMCKKTPLLAWLIPPVYSVISP